MRKILTLLFFICLFSINYSQDIFNKDCAFGTILNSITKVSPNYESEYKQLFQDLKSKYNNNRLLNQEDTVYTIQVAIHIVYLNNNKYENIPDSIIISQIDALNRDFNALNSDSTNLRDFFKPFKGNAKIKFELAKFRPNGSPTTGIEHVQGKLGSVGNSIQYLIM